MNTQMNRQVNRQTNRMMLTNEQMNAIYCMVGNNQKTLLYTSPDYDYGRKVYSMADNSAAIGDVCHILCHGFTIGGVVHQLGRSARWAQIAENAYQRGLCHNLKSYKWNDAKRGFFGARPQQVVVIGSRYLTLYMEGELSRKEIYFDKIVRIDYERGTLSIIVEGSNGRYARVDIFNIFDQMEDLVATVILNTMRAKM